MSKPMRTVVYPSARKWLDAVCSHDCRNPVLIPIDVPTIELGYLCLKCGKWMSIKEGIFKRTHRGMTTRERQCFTRSVKKNRIILANIATAKSICVEHEVPL